jgi:HPt (histidine-containing phosphotransfer) domain-containing protein
MTAPDPPVPDFDEAPLREIAQSLPRPDFVAFLEDYLKSARGHLGRATACHAAGDPAGLAAEAHTLISITGSYGLTHASLIARRLNMACKAGTSDEAAALLAELTAAAERGWDALRRRFLLAEQG